MTGAEQLGQDVTRLNRTMEERARDGRWADFAVLMRQRDQMLSSLPEERRREALEAALATTARILAHAETDRERTRERLENVRQKGAVQTYYKKHGGASSN